MARFSFSLYVYWLLEGVKGVYDRCLDIELLEAVEGHNGFECTGEYLNVSVRESRVEDQVGFYQHASSASDTDAAAARASYLYQRV